jgi:hypothetical protein
MTAICPASVGFANDPAYRSLELFRRKVIVFRLVIATSIVSGGWCRSKNFDYADNVAV